MKKKISILGIIIFSLCIQLIGVAAVGKAADKTISITEFYNSGVRDEGYEKALAGTVVTISDVAELRIFFVCLKEETWTKGISFRQEADISFSNYTFTYDQKKELTEIREDGILLGVAGLGGGFYLDDSLRQEVDFGKIGDQKAYILGGYDVFAGEYDGQGYSISGFILKGKDQMYNGLFGHIMSSGSIRNVHVKNALAHRSAGLISGLNEGTIKGCVVESVIGYGSFMGGIAESSSGELIGCKVRDSILAVDNIDFIWDYPMKIGGITGSAYSGRVDGCIAENVKIYIGIGGEIYAGGVVGYASHAKITNSCSVAECISVTENNKSIAGGIVGKVEVHDNVEIQNCFFAGKINASIAGGIIGSSELGFKDKTLDVENCITLSHISGKVTGGIVAEGNVGSLCYNYYYDAGNEKAIAVQDKQLCMLKKNYAVNESQIFGLESAGVIGEGIQKSSSLLDVLNNWVGEDSAYLEWKKGELGYPVLDSRLNGAFNGDYDFRKSAEEDNSEESTDKKDDSEDAIGNENQDTDNEKEDTSGDSNQNTDSENDKTPEDGESDSIIQSSITEEQLMLMNTKIKVTEKLKIKLTWDKNPYAKGYQIFRSTKSAGGYKKIGTVSLSKAFYVDKKVQPGKKYYYKVCAYAKNNGKIICGESQKKEAELPWYQAPVVQLSKGKVTGTAYVQLVLKKYSGTHIEVYFSSDKKNYYKAALGETRISGYKGKLRFSYSKKNVLYCKVRTYQIKNGKKQYSLFSKVKKIQL